MDIAIKLGQVLLSLSLLIILHELGHFVPAKLFKTKVEKFYLFFDWKFSLFKKKIGETVYGIGWLPLGGYVKIAGMIDESMDTEQMKKDPQPWEFRSKPAWQRLIIMLGGVIVNFIVAFLIYIGLSWFYGEKNIDNSSLKDGVWVVSTELQEAGLQTGDKILAVDGKTIQYFNTANAEIVMGKHIEVERNGVKQTIDLPENFIEKIIDGSQKQMVASRIPFFVGGVMEDSPNAEVLKIGDQFTAINGEPLNYFDEAGAILEKYANQKVTAEVQREGVPTQIELQVNAEGKIGVAPGMIPIDKGEEMGLYKVIQQDFSLIEAIPHGLHKGQEKIGDYVKQLKMIFTPKTGAYKGVGGFKAIYDIFPTTWHWEAFWNITALLSIMLGVLNLLPIPALDGGHVLFLIYEIITGKKPNDKFLEYAQTVGFFILLALLLFANGNDILKAFK